VLVEHRRDRDDSMLVADAARQRRLQLVNVPFGHYVVLPLVLLDVVIDLPLEP
jgi:hypothetical protein